LVERVAHNGDGRVVLVRITERGEAVAERLDGVMPGVHRGQFGALSEAEKRELNRLLEKAREG
jgi:DNA-binding MarR family transcriptional regulator